MSGRTGYLGNSGTAVTKNHRAYPPGIESELAGPNCRQSFRVVRCLPWSIVRVVHPASYGRWPSLLRGHSKFSSAKIADLCARTNSAASSPGVAIRPDLRQSLASDTAVEECVDAGVTSRRRNDGTATLPASSTHRLAMVRCQIC